MSRMTMQIKRKNIRKPGNFNSLIENNKAMLFTALLVTFLIILIFFIKSQDRISADIEISFSIYPEHKKGAIAVAIFYDTPSIDTAALQKIANTASKNNIPITMFFTARTTDKVIDEAGLLQIINEDPHLDFNISEIIEIIETEKLEFEIGSAGYLNIPYNEISYKYQENFIRKSKLAFRKNRVNIKGFLPPNFGFSYDTILAAENNKLDFFLILSINDTEPLHPESVEGGKMSILAFPVAQKEVSEGMAIQFINPEELGYNALDSFFFSMNSNEEKDAVLLSEMTDYIIRTEKISATIITDLKKASSAVTFQFLVNGTKVEFDTDLGVKSINDISKNISLPYYTNDNGFYIVLNESTQRIDILWNTDK